MFIFLCSLEVPGCTFLLQAKSIFNTHPPGRLSRWSRKEACSLLRIWKGQIWSIPPRAGWPRCKSQGGPARDRGLLWLNGSPSEDKPFTSMSLPGLPSTEVLQEAQRTDAHCPLLNDTGLRLGELVNSLFSTIVTTYPIENRISPHFCLKTLTQVCAKHFMYIIRSLTWRLLLSWCYRRGT